jgi:hypothetical protein
VQDSEAVQSMPTDDVVESNHAAVPAWASSGAPGSSSSTSSLSSRMWRSGFQSVVSHLGVPNTIPEEGEEDIVERERGYSAEAGGAEGAGEAWAAHDALSLGGGSSFVSTGTYGLMGERHVWL